MKFFPRFALLASPATAAPVQMLFNLVTASNNSHNGLYLSTQSTGPLNSKAVFRDPVNAGTFYLDNHSVRFEAHNGAPWAMALFSGSNVAGRVGVSVAPSSGSSGFELSDGGALTTTNNDFGGWLVCEDQSSGSLPGLYYINKSVGGGLPDSCDEVQLVVKFKTSP
ncbi:hypothetical protein N7474_002624 [Penicillium riverlandense]|uniref:uncharacterized protein n=1 Tax=Penicillium riverlandense TaxID=1903569 RepID=UPI002546B390|nr:uncharacterized protein N7474_002624 [Penicillium riverlandense]KAJ5825486.1 hypothetical protein N7474_002624 [Penicillium riverlandense]